MHYESKYIATDIVLVMVRDVSGDVACDASVIWYATYPMRYV